MDDTSQNPLPRVIQPQEGESITDYLQRYTNDELKVIFSHPTLSAQMSETILNTCQYIHEESPETQALRNLWMEMKKMKNYGHIKQFVKELRLVRGKLLKALDYYAIYIEEYAKNLSVLKLICSAGDITGSVLGMFMRESSSFDYSDIVFKGASVLGFAGLLSTVTETYLIKSAIQEIMQQIIRDQDHYDKIQKWFQQTKELKEAMLNVFSFETRDTIFKYFSKAVDSEIQKAEQLENFFRRVIETDINQLRNGSFLEKVLTLLSIPGISELTRLVNCNFNQVDLEIMKMTLQLRYSSLEHMFFQHIPSLQPCQQNFSSIPVWVRLLFNFMSTLHSIKTLKNSEISTLASEISILREKLEDQLKKLDEIINYVEFGRKDAINMALR